MTTTTDRRDDARSDSTTEAAVPVAETSGFMAGDDRAHSANRLTRVNWLRLVGFLVLIPAWALSAVPLARELIDGRVGARVGLTYLAVAGIALGVVAAVRGVYVLFTKRRFWSPWMFLVAAVLALGGHSVQTAGMEEPEIPPAAVLLDLS